MRILLVMHQDREYKIPELWLLGYLQTHKDARIIDAVAHWISQAHMEQTHDQ